MSDPTTPDTDAATADALDAFVSDLQQAGESVFLLGSDTHANVETIPTGAVSLDVALGVGGIPRGRIIELYGPESGGKTSMTLAMAAQAQKRGLNVGFVDAEHALDPNHARAYGIDVDRLAFYQPMSGEDGLGMVEKMASSGVFGLVIVDSVAALTPREELEGDMDDQQMGLQARMMGKGMRKIAAAAGHTRTAVVFINQIREKIGVLFGNPETTPGGRALKFFSSVRMEVRSAAGDRITASGKKSDAPIGQTLRVKVVKNKVAPPHRRAEFDIYYDSGVDVGSAVLEAGKELGILDVRGSSVMDVVSGERIAIGKANFSQRLADEPVLAERLTESVYRVMRGGDPISAFPPADDDGDDGDGPDLEAVDAA